MEANCIIKETAWNGNINLLTRQDEKLNGKSVFIIRGGNIENENLFKKGSLKSLMGFLHNGFSVYLLDIIVDMDYTIDNKLPKRNLAVIIKEALLNIPKLSRIQIYAHARHDINLTYPGGELSSTPISDRVEDPYNSNRIFIGDLKVGNPHSKTGLIDLYMCMTDPKVRWAQLMSNSLGWVVRTVSYGYSIYFPKHIGYPRSKIASSRYSFISEYDPNGWIICIPDNDYSIQTTEPSEFEFLARSDLIQKQEFKRHIAKFFEPFRKKRREIMRNIAIKKKMNTHDF